MWKRRLEINDKARSCMSKNYKSLVIEVEGYENLPFEEKDCQNYIDTLWFNWSIIDQVFSC